MLGIGIIIPILAPLLLDPGDMLIGMEESNRNLVYGYLIASFSVCQFFFAPLIGILSDRYGRKPVLFYSLFLTLAGYLLFAYGISTRNLILLFVGRSLAGIAAGNLSVIYSAIADVSSPEDKAKNFGLVGMAFGLGFIIGPVLGGVLADSDLVSWFNFSTPFLFAAFLVSINIVQARLFFRETLEKTNPDAELSLFTGIKNLKKAFGNPDLASIFGVLFFITFGFTFFTQFIQPYLIKVFDFDQADIGYLFGYIGIVIAITQGGLVRIFSKKFKPKSTVRVTILLLVGAFLILLWPENAWQFYLVLPFAAIMQGLTQPNLSSMLSNAVPDHLQGETLGMQQSVQSLATMLPPIIGGYVLSLRIDAPILLAAAVTMVAWLVFLWRFRK